MSDDAPIRLEEAAETIFGGHITASSLRAERDRGKLRTFKYYGMECTTRNELQKLILSNVRRFERKENIQPNRPPIRSGIYIIGYGSKVKIGITVDFARRFSNLKATIPEELLVYGFIDGGNRDDEKKLHKRFEMYRITGEWFHKTGALADWIKARCRK